MSRIGTHCFQEWARPQGPANAPVPAPASAHPEQRWPPCLPDCSVGPRWGMLRGAFTVAYVCSLWTYKSKMISFLQRGKLLVYHKQVLLPLSNDHGKCSSEHSPMILWEVLLKN